MTDETKYPHIMQAVYSTPWSILPEKLAVILDLIHFRAEGGMLTAEEVQQRIGAVARPALANVDNIAVLPIFGTIIPRANMLSESSGGTSIERFRGQFRQAMADPSVRGIVLDVDSPGGVVSGIDEMAAEMHQARGAKPIVALANSMAASAAYWLATAADEIVVTPTGEVGSVGVVAAHQDRSGMMNRMGVKTTLISAGKFKAEANPFEPLGEEARAAIQERVNDYYDMFIRAIARHRGVSADDVRGGFGEGRVVGARRALKLGMADRIDTLDGVLARMGRQIRQGDRATASAESVEFVIEPAEIASSSQTYIITVDGLNDVRVGEPEPPRGRSVDFTRRRLRLAERG